MSISWKTASVTAPSAGPPTGREVAEDRVVGGDQRGALGGELEVVQVGLQAVAGLDVGDVGVGAVGDHVVAEAEAVHRDVALPPRQHRPAVVLLDAQVGRRGVRRQRLEPHAAPPFGSRIIGPAWPGPA